MMSTYSRRHYVDIGNTLKKLPKKKRQSEYKKDNPRYDSKRFKKHIGL